ncbi:MAG: TIGR00282 family metallophosphoesterase [Candidatus Kapabacteria bacterium]|nr:TIGR00282 family metallophosphoesterase [Candidatus Kapabacteria bacterium]
MAENINILFLGDIVGDAGMKIACEKLPVLIECYNADCVVINGENAYQGKGLNERQAEKLFAAGAHVITSGNHIWENWLSRPLLEKNQQVIRPYNYPRENQGMGYAFHTLESGQKVGVINLQGRTYMQSIDCPFKGADEVLEIVKAETNIVFIDFHAEATAEKSALGWYLDGQVSALVGTHTHVQTADACILPRGTAFITDVGMCGAYNSVLGLKKEVAIKRFTLQTAHKYESAGKDPRVCGVCVGVDTESGRAVKIENFTTPAARKTVEYQD